jgi:hypothetical protein
MTCRGRENPLGDGLPFSSDRDGEIARAAEIRVRLIFR